MAAPIMSGLWWLAVSGFHTAHALGKIAQSAMVHPLVSHEMEAVSKPEPWQSQSKSTFIHDSDPREERSCRHPSGADGPIAA
ncbi:hypothetical protein E4U53_001314 [Claviceps sorghi]|nr:hypothetical protein E4U53_001314 [Claviceps sorghi]